MSRQLAQLVPAANIQPRDVVHVLVRAEVHTVTRVTITTRSVDVYFDDMSPNVYGPRELVAIAPRPRTVAVYRATWADGQEDDADNTLITLTEGDDFGQGADMIDDVIIGVRDALGGVGDWSPEGDTILRTTLATELDDEDALNVQTFVEFHDFDDAEMRTIRTYL